MKTKLIINEFKRIELINTKSTYMTKMSVVWSRSVKSCNIEIKLKLNSKFKVESSFEFTIKTLTFAGI